MIDPKLRIVSLIASATEIVHALGLGGFMVGRSHECDYPAAVKNMPVCTSPKFNVDGTSYEIDQEVRAVLQEALSVYRVDADMLNQLRPSHIITQSQCEVCAVSLKDVEEAACSLIGSAPQIISLKPDSLADIWADVKRVGAALGVDGRATALLRDMDARLDNIRAQSQLADSRPSVACIEWIDPLMAAGNWMPELVAIAGGENLFGLGGAHSPAMQFADLKARDPDVIIVMPCGFDIKRTCEDMPFLIAQAGWQELSAVKGKRVFVADGNQFFNRPGPRVVESLEIVAELIHPELFSFGHQGYGWIEATACGADNSGKS
jgi:iron complex transport system substrate-binding protein